VDAGCDAVKFQKRTVDVVYTAEELAKPRENPFGPTNGDLKRGLEFGKAQYQEIDQHCREKGILWFASCWDEASVDFIEKFDPPCYKIASASLTDDGLLHHHRKTGRPLILSTGMSTLAQVDRAVEILGKDDLILLHTNSTYPAKLEELNIRTMLTLAERYGVPAGYSGHEVGLAPSVGAAAIGACMLERHITLDRAMWGSDQAASVETQGFARLVRDVRAIEMSFGDGQKRVYDTEVPIMKKLRRKG
jgi:N-acetylneuraminate synthase